MRSRQTCSVRVAKEVELASSIIIREGEAEAK